MNKLTKIFSLALLSASLVQQVFAQGNPNEASYGRRPVNVYNNEGRDNPVQRGYSVQQQEAIQRGNIVNDPDNTDAFEMPDNRFDQRNGDFLKYTESQCPRSMHFTQPNHPSNGPGSQGQ